MNQEEKISKKRKKYLEPCASDPEKKIPRSTAWLDKSQPSTSTAADSPDQSTLQDIPIEAREEAEFQSDTDSLYIRDQQSAHSFTDFNESDDEQPDADLYSQYSESSEDSSSLSDDDDDPVSQGGAYDNIFKSKGLKENLKKLDVPLFENAQATVADTLLMAMTFAMKHKLTWTAVEDLLKLLNSILGISVLPKSKYSLQKLFGTCDSMTFHFYCTDCCHYLGKYHGQLTKTFDTSFSSLKCPNPRCQKVHDCNHLKESNFFATLSIRNQISALLDLDHIKESLSSSLKKIDENLMEITESLSDITDGDLYKEKRREMMNEGDISLILNTDGSPVFKSSRVSMWLIQAQINELPPELRWVHGIIGGLWFGKGHPNMKLFMQAYVEELSELASEGIKWTHSGKQFYSRVYTLCGCFDSPARSAVQNMVQFNGYFGCPWCLHPGVLVDGTVKYVTQEEEPELRTETKTLRLMEKAIKEKTNQKGIKGPSPLINAKGLHFIRGICPEYMHAVLLGVVRQVTELYFTSVGEPYYIGSPSTMNCLDRRLLSIKPPKIFTRLPRSLHERKYWKAHEWKRWLLFYSVPCLRGVLPEKFLLHLSLLSDALFLLLQEKVHLEDINRAEKMMIEFVIKTEILFGPAAMTFNIHQLLHLPSSVRDLGPLWAHSAFVFEGENGRMLNLVAAAKGVPLQILNKFGLEKKLQHLFHFTDSPPKALTFYQGLHSHNLLKKCYTVDSNLHMLGTEKVRTTFSEPESQAYLAALGKVPDVVSEYSRVILHSCLYHSESYTRAGKSDNTVVEICSDNERKYVKILKFILVKENSGTDCLMLCCELLPLIQVNRLNYLPMHISERQIVPHDHAVLVPVKKIKGICAYLNVENFQYVCNIPNYFEKD